MTKINCSRLHLSIDKLKIRLLKSINKWFDFCPLHRPTDPHKPVCLLTIHTHLYRHKLTNTHTLKGHRCEVRFRADLQCVTPSETNGQHESQAVSAAPLSLCCHYSCTGVYEQLYADIPHVIFKIHSCT